MMMPLKRPPRQDEIAVAARLVRAIHLKERVLEVKVLGHQPRLIVEARAARVVIDFLQTDQVRVLLLDHLQNPFQAVAPVAAADALVNVVAEKSHRSAPRAWGGPRSESVPLVRG